MGPRPDKHYKITRDSCTHLCTNIFYLLAGIRSSRLSKLQQRAQAVMFLASACRKALSACGKALLAEKQFKMISQRYEICFQRGRRELRRGLRACRVLCMSHPGFSRRSARHTPFCVLGGVASRGQIQRIYLSLLPVSNEKASYTP